MRKSIPKITLTLDGKNVAKIGLSGFLNNIVDERETKLKNLKWSITYYKWYIPISIIAILISLVLGMIDYCNNENNEIKRKDYYKKTQVDSLINKINRDFKHDSMPS